MPIPSIHCYPLNSPAFKILRSFVKSTMPRAPKPCRKRTADADAEVSKEPQKAARRESQSPKMVETLVKSFKSWVATGQGTAALPLELIEKLSHQIWEVKMSSWKCETGKDVADLACVSALDDVVTAVFKAIEKKCLTAGDLEKNRCKASVVKLQNSSAGLVLAAMVLDLSAFQQPSREQAKATSPQIQPGEEVVASAMSFLWHQARFALPTLLESKASTEAASTCAGLARTIRSIHHILAARRYTSNALPAACLAHKAAPMAAQCVTGSIADIYLCCLRQDCTGDFGRSLLRFVGRPVWLRLCGIRPAEFCHDRIRPACNTELHVREQLERKQQGFWSWSSTRTVLPGFGSASNWCPTVVSRPLQQRPQRSEPNGGRTSCSSRHSCGAPCSSCDSAQPLGIRAKWSNARLGAAALRSMWWPLLGRRAIVWLAPGRSTESCGRCFQDDRLGLLPEGGGYPSVGKGCWGPDHFGTWGETNPDVPLLWGRSWSRLWTLHVEGLGTREEAWREKHQNVKGSACFGDLLGGCCCGRWWPVGTSFRSVGSRRVARKCTFSEQCPLQRAGLREIQKVVACRCILCPKVIFMQAQWGNSVGKLLNHVELAAGFWQQHPTQASQKSSLSQAAALLCLSLASPMACKKRKDAKNVAATKAGTNLAKLSCCNVLSRHH